MNLKIEREVVGLQNCMVAAAQRSPLPKRFKDESSRHSSLRKITDIKTGKSVVVPLCDYSGARKTLSTLFGD